MIQGEPSLREKNVTQNYKFQKISNLFLDATLPAKGKPQHVRLRLIRTGRIRKIMKQI